jgi:cell division protein FtsN
MKKTIVFCLFCVIFTLIPVSVCFGQTFDWSDWPSDTGDYLDPTEANDDFSDSVTSSGAEPAPVAESAPVPAPSAVDSSAEADKAVKLAADSAKIAEEAARQATEAAKQATEAAAAVATRLESASTAESAKVSPAPPPAPPQPPVRIVIPMMTPPPAQYAPPPPPPVQPAPPAYRQPPTPSPYSNCLYRVQVGAFSDPGRAQQCLSRLLSAGFSPTYEPYVNLNVNLTRVVLPGIRAADVPLIVQRLAAAGFNEVWVREEK